MHQAPSMTTILLLAYWWRMASAGAYSGEFNQALACSTDGNSIITSREGFQSPSSVSVFPPRAM